MATNPMQRKARISFLLGMLVTLVIAGIGGVFLYSIIQKKDQEIATIKGTSVKVWIATQDIKSGDVIDSSLFTQVDAPSKVNPSNSGEIDSLISSAQMRDTDGRKVNSPDDSHKYYFYRITDTSKKEGYVDRPLYVKGSDDTYITSVEAGKEAYFYQDDTKTQKVEVTFASGVVAKVDIKANTIITDSLIAPSSEKTTHDMRKEEFNVFSLPVDLQPNEYVDIRFKLPTGENFVVLSKKKVTIPMSNGEYIADTIQLNLTEEENLLISAAIIENYKIGGSELYASRYTEAGNQKGATITYIPNDEVWTLLRTDKNVVVEAINGIAAERQNIRNLVNAALNKYAEVDDNVKTKVEEKINSSLEERKTYLQSLTAVAPTE